MTPPRPVCDDCDQPPVSLILDGGRRLVCADHLAETLNPPTKGTANV